MTEELSIFGILFTFINSLQLPQKKGPSLPVCILLDIVGMSSYLFPVVGEAIDFIWAPISGIVFYLLFGKSRFGLFGGIFSMLEEISPGLDVIPTFTIAWFIKNRETKKLP